MSRLILVSNRVVLGAAAPGGLVVSLLATMRAHRGLWFGWDGEICSLEVPPVAIGDCEGVTCATVPLPERLYERYYNGFANGTLWPLFHDFLDGFRYDADDYAAYLEANKLFASRLAPLVKNEDLIWVHDYHLIPLAEKLRAQGLGNRIGYFLHAPFPPFETLRALPTFEQFVINMLAYDVLGFQTEISRQHFLGAVRTICGESAVTRENALEVGGGSVRTHVLPVGIDVDTVSQEANEAAKSDVVKRLVQSLQGRALILGVDRLDYSKGVIERFDAYGRFLETFPEDRSKVVLLQISPLSREKVAAYARIRAALEQTAGRINGRFADADWTPIRYLNRDYPHSTLMGLMRAATVCVVTALQDGMNLVAKEFVGAQDLQNPGVLVLSNRTGAAQELTDALVVNPYDLSGVAQAISQALTMPLAERRVRHAQLLAKIKENDIHRWHHGFVGLLQGAKQCDCARRRETSLDVRVGT